MMTPKMIINSFVISSFFFISCKKELEPQENTPTSELVRLGLVQDTTKTQSVIEKPVGSPNVVINRGTAISGAVNPEHGQPGHRCDIAVGAPLNSAVPKKNPAQQNKIATPTATPLKIAEGMNPSHGQPGHRCDIAVGAPLNSPVATKTATEQTVTSPNYTVTPPAATTPAVPDLLRTENTNTAAVATTEGTNPAHGKEGHRCDIAVGAPLPKP